MADSFPNLVEKNYKRTYLRISKNPERKRKKTIPKHIIIILLKTHDKKKNLRSSWEVDRGVRKTCYIQRNKDKDYSRLLIENNA